MAKRETEPIDPNDGQRVVELRKYMGMTQLQLAKALGLSVGAIQHMENGRARITSQRFRQLAKVLRVETADLAKPPGSPLPRFLCEEPHDSTEEKNRRPPILGIDDLSNLGFYAWDPLTDQVTRDPSLKSLIGLPTDAPPDLIQWRNIVHPEYLPRVDAILAKSREPGSDGSFYVEYPVVGRDGAERWVAECGRMIFDARRPSPPRIARLVAEQAVGSWLIVPTKSIIQFIDRDMSELDRMVETFEADAAHEVLLP